jgi:hypothetical protein
MQQEERGIVLYFAVSDEAFGIDAFGSFAEDHWAKAEKLPFNFVPVLVED